MQEVVKAQILMGIDGVIVDLIQEITEVVSDFRKTYKKENVVEEEADEVNCSQNQLSNLMKLIPGLGKL